MMVEVVVFESIFEYTFKIYKNIASQILGIEGFQFYSVTHLSRVGRLIDANMRE